MIRQTHLRDRGSLSLVTAALASLLVACGSGDQSSPETVAPSESAADALADDSKSSSSGRTASLTFGDETIAFTVGVCANPGGGTFAFSGSTSRENGQTVDIMVRGTQGQSLAIITIGPPGSVDAREWRGGPSTTTASIDGGVLTAAGEAVGLDSTLASTDETRPFSINGPCVAWELQ